MKRHRGCFRVESEDERWRRCFIPKLRQQGECVVWTGCLDDDGYGWFSVDGKRMPAHRYAYERANGPIPEGLQLDHLCRTHPCVHVDHVEPVTQRENILRGESPYARKARQTQCKNGHEFNPENTYRRADGTRVCRRCRSEGMLRKYRLAKSC